jgi:hypothetical protein
VWPKIVVLQEKNNISFISISDYQLITLVLYDDPSTSTKYSYQRQRRSVPNLRDNFFLNLTAFNHTFQVHLRRNQKFVTSESLVHYRYGNASMQSERIDRQCYFKGHIASRKGKAAVSLCDGLVSYNDTTQFSPFSPYPKPWVVDMGR